MKTLPDDVQRNMGAGGIPFAVCGLQETERVQAVAKHYSVSYELASQALASGDPDLFIALHCDDDKE